MIILIILPIVTIAVSRGLQRGFFVPLIEWTRKMLPMISDVKPINRSIRYNEWFQGGLSDNIQGEVGEVEIQLSFCL